MVVSLTMTIGVMIIDDVDNSEDDDKDDNDEWGSKIRNRSRR